jgi:Tol biopolymer transport system component
LRQYKFVVVNHCNLTLKFFLEGEAKMKNLIIYAAVLLFIGLFSMPATAEWNTPQLVGGVANTSAQESWPFLSSDGTSLYFSRSSTSAGIYQATRSTNSGPFTSVTGLTSLGEGTWAPRVTSDNLRMYYSGPGWTLKMTQRNSVTDPWTAGTGIIELNSGRSLATPSVSSDELTIVFVGGNPTGDAHGADLYMATRANKTSPFGNIIPLVNANSSYMDIDPFVSPDGLSLYFTSSRSGMGQLYESTRNSLTDSFGVAQAVSFINKPNLQMGGASLSNDGQALYFNMYNGNNWDMYVSYNVPEPATIALLGIGAMILRRKK